MAGTANETVSKPTAAAAVAKEGTPAKEAPTLSVETREAPVFNLAGRHRPIVVNVKKGKRRKRKYSKGTKGLQVRMRRGSKAGDRLARAISSGFSRYRRKSDRSSRKKRDGAARDMLRNMGSGLGKTMRKSYKVPRLVAKAVEPNKRTRRRIRRLFRR